MKPIVLLLATLAVGSTSPLLASEIRFEGEAVILNDSPLANKIAKDEAELNAVSKIWDYLLEDAFHKNWTKVLKESARNAYIQSVGDRAFTKVTGWRVDLPRKEGDRMFVTVYLNSEALDKNKVSAVYLKESIMLAASPGQFKIDPAILFEISTNSHDYVATLMGGYWSKIAGEPTLMAILKGEILQDLPDLYRQYDESAFSENINKLNLEQLFSIFGDGAYLPAICEAISQKYRDMGYTNTASYVAGLSRLSGLAGALELEDYSPDASVNIGNPQEDARTVSLLDPAYQTNILVQVVYKSGGQLPVVKGRSNSKLYSQAVVVFNSSKDKIDECLKMLIGSLAEDFSADQCNLIGRCIELSGQPEASRAWYRQAYLSDKNHPYAMENLVRVISSAD